MSSPCAQLTLSPRVAFFVLLNIYYYIYNTFKITFAKSFKNPKFHCEEICLKIFITFGNLNLINHLIKFYRKKSIHTWWMVWAIKIYVYLVSTRLNSTHTNTRQILVYVMNSPSTPTKQVSTQGSSARVKTNIIITIIHSLIIKAL